MARRPKFRRARNVLGNRVARSFPGGGDQDRRKTSQEPRDRLKERLYELERKLEPGGEGHENMSDEERDRRGSALGKALRLSTELVAGVFVGGFLGLLLDRWLKTLPLFLVVFLLLGIAAGLMSAVREARKMGEK